MGPGVDGDQGLRKLSLHGRPRLQLGLLFKYNGEQGQAVAQRARHGDAVKPGKLIGDQIVERDPALLAVVARVRPRMDRADRHHEAEPIGGGHVAAAPGMGERDTVLGCDKGSV